MSVIESGCVGSIEWSMSSMANRPRRPRIHSAAMEGRIFIQFIALLITTRLKQVMNEAGWFKNHDLRLMFPGAVIHQIAFLHRLIQLVGKGRHAPLQVEDAICSLISIKLPVLILYI